MGCNTSQEPLKVVGDQKPPEVIDIDLEDPKTEEAATKIQAAFRGHQVRRKMSNLDQTDSEANLEQEFSADDKELCDAAVKIQASFRGHLARKSNQGKKETEELSKELEKLETAQDEKDEEVDVDLNDPELAAAATKIQASFRGHKVRKEKGNL